MTNDYMFRYVLHKNEKVLRGLICSLLYHGQDYRKALPVIHIGFLDYTLFPDSPEFYATNMLMNVKNHRIYNDKFRLSVVDLTQIKLATEEDKTYQIDYWARLFKAKTWEDLKMLAEKNEYLEEAAQSVYVANADEIVRQKCYAREMAIGYELALKDQIEKEKAENARKDATISEQSTTISKQNTIIAEQNTTIAELKAEITRLQKITEEK